MAKTRKEISLNVTVSVPKWMTAAEARREVRTLINNQSNYMSGRYTRSGDWVEVDDKSVRAKAVA